jgi:hypothetical protein
MPVDQEQLVAIFDRLKELLKEYEGLFTPKLDLDSRYDLWSFKDIDIDGRKRKEIYFAGLIIQSSYVGFYYMPIYTDAKLEDVFGSELLRLKRGKSCFHVRTLDGVLEDQIRRALRIGFDLYRKRGWL